MIELARISFGERRTQVTGEFFNRKQLRLLERWGVITSDLMQNRGSGQVVRLWKRT